MSSVIDSVYNYCHRWCERCPFTERCGLFTRETPGLTDMIDEVIPLPNAFPALSGRFADFLERLDVQLKQRSSSIFDIGYGAEQETPAPTRMGIKPLEKLSMEVAMNGVGSRNERPVWLPELYSGADFTDPAVQAGHELYWYINMIGPKFRRCFHGTPYDEDEKKRYGIYGRGAAFTARLTHIILARTVCAATVLIEQRGQPAYDDLLKPLTNVFILLAGLREHHSDAYLHRRPGFDDAGERQVLEAFYKGHPPVDPFADGTWSRGGRAPE